MKRAFKFSMILLLSGIAGTGSVIAAENSYIENSKMISEYNNDKEKKKAEKEVQPKAGEPFFRTNDEMVSLSLLNLDEGPVELSIYDADGRKLYKEIVTGENSVGKQFDFSQVEQGVYTIVVKDECNQYYKKLDKH